MKQDKQNINSFGYKGVVTLKILKNNRVIRTLTTHNEGSTELFRIMLSQLCGNNEAKKLPCYLDVTRVDKTSGLLNRIKLTGIKLDSVEGVPCAYFSALILANQFKKQGVDIIKFALYGENNYSSNIDTYLAQVSLTQEQINELNNFVSLNTDIQKIYSSYNLLVEWRMFISNADVQRLATPNVTVTSNSAQWTAIPGATSYNIMTIINGTATIHEPQEGTTYNLTASQKIQVQAVSSTQGYLESSWSTVKPE